VHPSRSLPSCRSPLWLLARLGVASSSARLPGRRERVCRLAEPTTASVRPLEAKAPPEQFVPSRGLRAGPAASVFRIGPYRVELRDAPNRLGKAGLISVQLDTRGRPVAGARIRVTFTSLAMDMGSLSGVVPQTAPGRYSHTGPLLEMAGRWRIGLEIKPRHGAPIRLRLIDHVAQ
jgi:YtkA-like